MPNPDPRPDGGSTTGSGAPAPSDRNSLTVGANGPLLLHDVHFLEQMAHFNREKVPERQPHAKGSGAFGTFETTEDVTRYTKAALFRPDTRTDLLARFSTVAGEMGSPDTWRDVRGFSLKFYTSEGNYDLVGNNTPVFFVRDPIRFTNFIRSQKRLPDSGLRDNHMQWDFWTLNPESAHQVTYPMGDRGLPRTWRHMNGHGSHTYMWVDARGERSWVKYHFISDQGWETFTNREAAEMAGHDADFHRRDLFEAVARGEHPTWTLRVQVMPYDDARAYRFNPFDLTEVWPHGDYPLVTVGTMKLDRNPENFFAEIEQAAFSPGNLGLNRRGLNRRRARRGRRRRRHLAERRQVRRERARRVAKTPPARPAAISPNTTSDAGGPPESRPPAPRRDDASSAADGDRRAAALRAPGAPDGSARAPFGCAPGATVTGAPAAVDGSVAATPPPADDAGRPFDPSGEPPVGAPPPETEPGDDPPGAAGDTAPPPEPLDPEPGAGSPASRATDTYAGADGRTPYAQPSTSPSLTTDDDAPVPQYRNDVEPAGARK